MYPELSNYCFGIPDTPCSHNGCTSMCRIVKKTFSTLNEYLPPKGLGDLLFVKVILGFMGSFLSFYSVSVQRTGKVPIKHVSMDGPVSTNLLYTTSTARSTFPLERVPPLNREVQ